MDKPNYSTYEVTQEMWDEFQKELSETGKRPEMIGAIWARDITGPGTYYLKGSYGAELDYSDMWRPISELQ